MTDVQDKTHELFTRAALADDDLGYPDQVSFLPGDQEWADEAAWELLHDEHKAVVVVTAEHEILMIPRRHNPVLHWLDGVRGSTPVRGRDPRRPSPARAHARAGARGLRTSAAWSTHLGQRADGAVPCTS